MEKIIKHVTNNDIKNGSFVIPKGVVEIVESMFAGCTRLERIIIPASVKKLVMMLLLLAKVWGASLFLTVSMKLEYGHSFIAKVWRPFLSPTV